MVLSPIELHPEAIAEARSARLWYARVSRDIKISHAFMFELDRALKQVAESPDRWPAFVHGTRRYFLQRFPYAVVYRVNDKAVQVLAVAHSRRRPGYWRDRA